MRAEESSASDDHNNRDDAFARFKQDSYKVLTRIEVKSLMSRDKIQWHIGRLLAAQNLADLEPYPTVFGLHSSSDHEPPESRMRRILLHLEHYRLYFFSALGMNLHMTPSICSPPTSHRLDIDAPPSFPSVEPEDEGESGEGQEGVPILTEILMGSVPKVAMPSATQDSFLQALITSKGNDGDYGQDLYESDDETYETGQPIRSTRRGRPPVACTCRYCGLNLPSRGELAIHERKAHGRGKGIKRVKLEQGSDYDDDSDAEKKKKKASLKKPAGSLEEPRRRGRPPQAVVCEACGMHLPSRVDYTLHLRYGMVEVFTQID